MQSTSIIESYRPSNPSSEFSSLANDEALALTLTMLSNCRSRELRDIIEFARTEIILPMDGGPYQGQPFNPDTQPYVKLLFHEMQHGPWSDLYIVGPSQSGKTLCAFVIPLAYIISELRTNCVVGVPDEKMVSDKWKVDIEKVFQATPALELLLPIKGAGSKGGTVKEFVEFSNGTAIKFMTRGGSDTSKAGFTARRLLVTEAAGWSDATETSKEADPLRQLQARLRATSRFDDDGNISTDRQMIVEGTVTDEYDLPWRAKPGTTESKIVCPCVHCGEHVTPEREHFGGWDGAKSELEAAKLGCFTCPACGQAYTDSERTAMNRAGKLLHLGQDIDKAGTITGVPPETSRLWFRWSAFNNLFLKQADIAADEWKAAQIEDGTPEKDDAEKELCQQVWAIPWSAKMLEHSPLRRTDIRKRRHRLPSGVIPSDKVHLTFGIDPGKWQCWYFGIASRADGTLHCPIFGARDTGLSQEFKRSNPQEGDAFHERVAIKNCLLELFELIERGFGGELGGLVPGNMTLVDSGYQPDAVYEALAAFDSDRFIASLGRGRSQFDARRYESPSRNSSIVREIGDRWHREYVQARAQNRIIFDADDSKLSVQACLRVKQNMPGALTLPDMTDNELKTVSRHLASEVFRQWIEPGKGMKGEYFKTGQNHWLDCAGMGWVGQRFLGWEIPSTVRAGKSAIEGAENAAADDTAIASTRVETWLSKRRKELAHAGD